MLDKNIILEKLKKREAELQHRADRDFTGGFDSSYIGRLKEISYWIGAIERGEFDIKKKG